MKYKPLPQQKKITSFQLSKGCSAIFSTAGSGKTAGTLKTIRTLHFLNPDLKVLIVAPLIVAYNTWFDEVAKWDQFKHLSISILHGAKKKERLNDSSTIHLINPEGLFFLFDNLEHDYDLLVIDESTKFKNFSSKRFKLLKKNLKRFKKRSILTGTPMPKGLENIFPQVFIVDGGATLGKSITKFRRQYFNQLYPIEYNIYEAKPEALKQVTKKIEHFSLVLKAKDFNKDYKELRVNNIYLKLPDKVQKKYNQLEKKLFTEIEDVEKWVLNASTKYGALKQMASGGLYKDKELNEDYFDLHKVKLEMIEHLSNELFGSPVLIGYHYKFSKEQAQKYFKSAKFIDSKLKPKEKTKIINQWNEDKVGLLFGQASSMAHGLNLHYGTGRNIVWFTLPDDLEIYDQFNARIYGRNGVKEIVTVHNLIMKNTIEEVIFKRLQQRDKTQKDFLNDLKNYYKRKY